MAAKRHKRGASMQPVRGVLALVQLPPPVNGLATANAFVTERLEAAGLLWKAVGIGPSRHGPGWLRTAVRAGRVAGAVLIMPVARLSGARLLYMPPDSAAGLLFNLVLLAWARLLGFRVWFHHHNFSYIDRHMGAMERLIRWAPRGSTHVVLCARMGEQLAERYPAAWAAATPRLLVLPNAVMVEAGEPAATDRPAAVVLGHLSNLTAEKGSDTVIDLFLAARRQGTPVRLDLAGPAGDAATRAAIARAEAEAPDAFRWLGPVYGAAKQDFYAGLDVFALPSRYVNEAQPIVLLEAQAQGAALLATDRGCIACDHSRSPGAVFTADGFVEQSTGWLASFAADVLADRERRLTCRKQARAAFEVSRVEADAAFRMFLDQAGLAASA